MKKYLLLPIKLFYKLILLGLYVLLVKLNSYVKTKQHQKMVSDRRTSES